MIPPLSFSGGAAGGADSGIVDVVSKSKLGNVNYTNNFKGTQGGLNPFLIAGLALIGTFVYLRAKK